MMNWGPHKRRANSMVIGASIALAIALLSIPLPWLMAHDRDTGWSWAVSALGRGEAEGKLGPARASYRFTYSLYPLGILTFSFLIAELLLSTFSIFGPPPELMKKVFYIALIFPLLTGMMYFTLLIVGIGTFSGTLIIYSWSPPGIIIEHEELGASEAWAKADALYPGVGLFLFMTSAITALLLYRSAWPKKSP